jgi:two-component system, OmpR family, response regulator MprA
MAERILIIEDEIKIADFLRRGLAYEGYKVEVTYDGETGLKDADLDADRQRHGA